MLVLQLQNTFLARREGGFLMTSSHAPPTSLCPASCPLQRSISQLALYLARPAWGILLFSLHLEHPAAGRPAGLGGVVTSRREIKKHEPATKTAYSRDIAIRVVWQRLGMNLSFREIARRLQIGVLG